MRQQEGGCESVALRDSGHVEDRRWREACVTVVVVSHESGHILGNCLDSLPIDSEVIVVDNASSDDSVSVAQRRGARALAMDDNVGYARACNLGARAASREFLLFLNPDVRLETGAVAALAAAAARYPNAAAFAPRLIRSDGSVFYRDYSVLCQAPLNGTRPRREPVGDCSVPMLVGAALLCRRDAFFAIGGFDERIFLYYEDDDLCLRFRQAGWSLVHVHDAVARHEEGASSRPGRAGAYFRSHHWAVSRSYVSRKHGVPFDPAHERRKAILRGCMAALRGAVDRRDRYFGLASGYRSVIEGRQ